MAYSEEQTISPGQNIQKTVQGRCDIILRVFHPFSFVIEEFYSKN